MEKSFHKDANTNAHGLFMICALAMIGFSIYLTSHYFETKFPTGFGGGGLCEINGFLSCDAITFSAFSNIAGVPISSFGILMGAFLLAGYMFRSDLVEGTNHFLLRVNAVGVVILFLYSLIGLGHLCPFCTVYYIFSIGALIVYTKNSDLKSPAPKVLAIYALTAIIASGTSYAIVQNKMDDMSKQSNQLIKLYDAIPSVGNPDKDYGYYIAKAETKFEDTPLRVIKFSDFQCPSCKRASDSFHQVVKRYKGNISIQYMFYPLDSNCNESMTSAMHPLACDASYLAACLPNKFAQVENDIFANQKDLTKKWITDYAKKEGVMDCYQSEETKTKVKEIIAAAKPFNVQGTPTIIINEKKIRNLPLISLYQLLDKLLERAIKK